MTTVIPAAPVKAFPVVVAGMTGPTGPGNFDGAGPPGPIGPTGPTGRAGATGPLGSDGVTGPTGGGSTGPAGPAGTPGTVGPTGPQGTVGAPGSAGATGPTGAQGTAGTPGTPGSLGATGPTGSQGTAGGIGSTGATGPAGAGSPSNVLPLMDGTATIGTSTNFAREGHIHPSDTSRAAVAYVDTQDALKVAKTGDTMTGDLKISKQAPALILDKTDNVGPCLIQSAYGGLRRWEINVSNNAVESNPANGSDFGIYAFDNAGNFLSNPLLITRSTGNIAIPGNIGIGATAGSIPGNGNSNLGVTIAPTGIIAASNASIQSLFLNNNTDGWVAAFARAGTNVGAISVSSTATAYNTSSDGRLKEDLKSFDAGNIIDDTNVYDFAWKSTGERSYGIIAQQAVEVYPGAVNYNEREDSWMIDYSKYVPVLLQELKALRGRVAELEGRVSIQPAAAP